MVLEYHPFGNFIPPEVKFLVVGTFPGRQYSQRSLEENEADESAFSYGGRNQFWRIMEKNYAVDLPNRAAKKQLFEAMNIGLIDLIHACNRKKKSSLDTDLTNIVWNKPQLDRVFKENNIEMTFCTGKGVAKIFQNWYPDKAFIALPSPSPLYAVMRFEEKLMFYKNVFPKKK